MNSDGPAQRSRVARPAASSDAAGDSPGLRLRGISKQFGDFRAVDDIALDVPKGALVSLLGPSGCGKTTTLRMIAGLEQPDRGEITVSGRTLFSDAGTKVPAERRRIGMVFQSYAVWPHMTVAQNVAYPLRTRRIAKAEAQSLMQYALDTVQLTNLADRYPSQLSGGQQQRVAVARAIVFQRDLLLLDEPLSNLEATLREEMRVELRTLQQRLGITAVFVTHDQAEALAMSDYVGVMSQGRLVQWGQPRDIYENPADRFVAEFVGWKNMLPGRIEAGNTVRLGDIVLPVSVPAETGTDHQVTIAMRPSDIRLATNDGLDRPGQVEVTLESVLFMGDHQLCEFMLAGKMVFGWAGPGDDIARGQTARFQIDLDRLLVLPS